MATNDELLRVAQGALGYLKALHTECRPDPQWLAPLEAAVGAASRSAVRWDTHRGEVMLQWLAMSAEPIVTVYVHGGVLGEVRMHGTEEAAHAHAMELLGPDMLTDDQARWMDGVYDNDVFVLRLRRDADEVRIETWVA